jgi:hypothetical protein
MFPKIPSFGEYVFSFCMTDVFFPLTALYFIELFQPGTELEQQQAKLPGKLPAYAPAMPGQLCQQPSLFRLAQKVWVMSLKDLLIEV